MILEYLCQSSFPTIKSPAKFEKGKKNRIRIKGKGEEMHYYREKPRGITLRKCAEGKIYLLREMCPLIYERTNVCKIICVF